MRTRIIVFAAILGVVYGALAGCDSSENQQRTIVSVSSINQNLPATSDPVCQGDTLWDPTTGFPNAFVDDDGVSEDWVQVIFFARPYSQALVNTAPGFPHGDFLVEGYRIEWTNMDPAGPIFTPTNDQTSIIIESVDEGFGYIRLVNFAQKSLPWVLALRYNAPVPAARSVEHLMAQITFYGREMGTDRVQEFVARLSVEVGDVITSDCNLNDTQ